MLADRIDSARLAELAMSRSEQAGHLGPEQLPRLEALLAQGSAAGLDVSVTFAPGEQGLAQLELAVHGDLQLVCQRCLGPLAWPVALTASLTVVANESEADSLEDPFESVVMDADGLRLDQLAEDEVLAAVPLAPRHQTGADCSAPGAPDKTEQELEGGTSRPFAELGAMLKAGQQRPEQD